MLNQLASWRVRTLPSSAVNARSLVTATRRVPSAMRTQLNRAPGYSGSAIRPSGRVA